MRGGQGRSDGAGGRLAQRYGCSMPNESGRREATAGHRTWRMLPLMPKIHVWMHAPRRLMTVRSWISGAGSAAQADR